MKRWLKGVVGASSMVHTFTSRRLGGREAAACNLAAHRQEYWLTLASYHACECAPIR